MKPVLRNSIVIFAIVAALLVVGLFWLLWTPSGARTALGVVSRFSPLEIEAGEVTGRLADELRLEGAVVTWPGGEAEVGRLLLRWSPASLLRSRLAVQTLAIEEVQVRLREAPPRTAQGERAPSDFRLPEPGKGALRWEAHVDDLRVEEFTLHGEGGEEAVYLRQMQARLSWVEGALSVEGLEANSPQGRVSGGARLDLVAPEIRVDLTAEPAEGRMGELEVASLHLHLEPVSAQREMAGALEVSSRSDESELFRLEGEVQWTPERIALSDFHLARPGRAGKAEGDLELVAGDTLRFEAAIEFAQIDLHPETGTRTDLSGTLLVSGSPRDFEGRFSLANDVDGWQQGSLKGPFTGSSGRIEFPGLTGEWLRGSLEGRFVAEWEGGWRAHGDLSAEGLDPAAVTPEWPGRVNFVLQGSAEGGGDVPASAEVKGELRRSIVRGRALTGEIDARVEGREVEIDTLALRGDGFDIGARGRLRERLDFRADVEHLGALLPDARGTLLAEGWGRFRDGALSGELSARGKGIEAGGARIEQVTIEADHRTPSAPFSVTADASGLAHGDLRVDAARVRAGGTVEDHRLQITLSGDDVQLHAQGEGGYREGGWRGTLQRFEAGGARLGAWTLTEPAPLRISASRIALAPFRLVGEEGASLSAEADLALSPKLGFVQGSWNRFNLNLLDPWIADTSLAGRSTGSLRAEWLSGDRLDLRGTVGAAGIFVREEGRLEVRNAQARLDWSPSGMQAQWEIDAEGVGRASGTFSSPRPAQFALPAAGEGEAKWILSDLSALSPWIPGVELSGTSSGDLTGDWHEGRPPVIHAQARMAGEVVREDLRLIVEEATAALDWDRDGLRGEWRVDLGEDGRATGRLASTDPPRAGLPEVGDLKAQWEGANLALLSSWLPDTEITGESSGGVDARWARERLDLQGNVLLSARVARDDLVLEVRRGEAEIAWGADGLKANWQIALDDEGRLSGEVTSAAPARLEAPQRGSYRARWEWVDLALLRSQFPPGMLVEGRLAGDLEGEWLPERRLRMAGEAEVREGEILWEGESGIVAAPLRQAEFFWDWRGASLEGGVNLVLTELGAAEGTFRIPVAARFPVEIDPSGPVRAALRADMTEEGLLNAFLPGLIQESRGRISLDLSVAGTWAQPDLGGEARLADAGAYLPAAGIRVEDVQLQARLQGDEIHLTSFRAQSGPGHLEGEGVLRLREWTPADYRLQLRGERFQTVLLPELRLLVSPDLSIEGTLERVRVRGEVRIPEMLIRGRQTPAPVQPSPDVVVVDAPERQERRSPVALDIRVLVVLGDRVLVDAEGIDARLEGSVRVAVRGLETEQITGQGEIKVAQGRYSAYGVNLTIERGNILFAGGPIDRPTLDILALRTVARTEGDVRAGVLIGGTPRAPEVTLYSEPTMTDTDILSYIVLGRPLGQGAEDPDLLLFAAGALLTRGESVVLQDRLRGRLGLDVLTLEGGGGDVTGSRITIGKYLSPELYISFGQSLFTNTQVVRLRYDVSRRVQLESMVGEESAVDLYYRIEFR